MLANIAGLLLIRTCQYNKNIRTLNEYNTTGLITATVLCTITFIKEEKKCTFLQEMLGIASYLFIFEHGEQILAVLCFQVNK